MKILNFLKNKFALAAVALSFCTLSAFAEGSGTSSTDTSDITTHVTDVGNALVDGIKAMVAAVAPIAVNILIASMVLGVIVIAIRWLWKISRTGQK